MNEDQYLTKRRQLDQQIAAYRHIEDRLAESSRFVAVLAAYGAPVTALDKNVATGLALVGKLIERRLEIQAELDFQWTKKSTAPYSS